MKNYSLSLRQRQLLNYLQQNNDYITGIELSKKLHVSARTIRNDVKDINDKLIDTKTKIVSKHSFGYKIECKNEEEFEKILRVGESFISRTERIRYIVVRLCLAENKINLYDLADEMYISKTTLEHDLDQLIHEFTQPFEIVLTIQKNDCFLEKDERKRRRLLVHLYSKDWNYNGWNNTYYRYQFMHRKDINFCLKTIHYVLDDYALRIEDTNLVHLCLSIITAVIRIKDGHVLEEMNADVYIEPIGIEVVDRILDAMEKEWDCIFPMNERQEFYNLFSCSILPNMEKIEKNGIPSFFDSSFIRFTNDFIRHLIHTYDLDFFRDNDFYNTLISYFRYLSLPIHHLNYDSAITDASYKNLSIELEIAYSIQDMAKEFYGRYLDQLELLYLAYIISGAYINLHHEKLHISLLCHLNMPVAWNMRIQIENHFSNTAHVDHLLPMYMKDHFDFSNTDLIITTTSKEVITEKNTKVIQVSPYLDDQDYNKINEHISELQFHQLYGRSYPSIVQLLEQAHWIEQSNESDYLSLLKNTCYSLLEQDIVDESYYEDLLRRNQSLGFVHEPVINLIYSSKPAKKTHIEVVTLNHRIAVNKQNIRLFIFLCVKKEDQGLIFKFLNEFYKLNYDFMKERFLKTKKEWIEVFHSL